MPTVAKREPTTPPLMRIAWTTKNKDRTRIVVITLGSPLPAILTFLGGSQLSGIQKVARSVWMALWAGR
jgi:hypothetical protein